MTTPRSAAEVRPAVPCIVIVPTRPGCALSVLLGCVCVEGRKQRPQWIESGSQQHCCRWGAPFRREAEVGMRAVVGIEHGRRSGQGAVKRQTHVHMELAKKNARKGSTRGTLLGVGVGEEVTTVRMAPSSDTFLSFQRKEPRVTWPSKSYVALRYLHVGGQPPLTLDKSL